MPVGIVDSLDPSGPSNIPAKQVLSSSFAENSDAIAGLLDGFTKSRNDKRIGDFAKDVSGITSHAAGYAQKMIELQQDYADAEARGDAEAVSKFHSDIRTLRRGQLQGTISPTYARMQIDQKTRDAINQYPTLASSFLEIKDKLANNLKDYDYKAPADPVSAAEDARLKADMEAYGGDFRKATIMRQYRQAADFATVRLDLALKNGQLDQTAFVDAVASTSNSVYVDVLNRLQTLVSSGSYNQTQASTIVANGMNALGRVGLSVRSRYEQEIVAQHGPVGRAMFSDDMVRQGTAPVQAALDVLKSQLDNYSSSKQQLEYLNMALAQAELGNIQQWQYMAGALAPYYKEHVPEYLELGNKAGTKVGKMINEFGGADLKQQLADDPMLQLALGTTNPSLAFPLFRDIYGKRLAGFLTSPEGSDPMPGVPKGSPARRRVAIDAGQMMDKPGLFPVSEFAGDWAKVVREINASDIIAWRGLAPKILVPQPGDDPATKAGKEQVYDAAIEAIATGMDSLVRNFSPTEVGTFKVDPTKGVTFKVDPTPEVRGTVSIRPPDAGGVGQMVAPDMVATPTQDYNRKMQAAKRLTDMFRVMQLVQGTDTAISEFNKMLAKTLGQDVTEIKADGQSGN